jgi:hypothetical protein
MHTSYKPASKPLWIPIQSVLFLLFDRISLQCDLSLPFIPFCRFSTGFGVSAGSTLIHDFYSREVQSPIHLIVDTDFTRGEASVKAYISTNLSLGDRHLAAQFQEIPLDLRMIEAQKTGCMFHFYSRQPLLWIYLVRLEFGTRNYSCLGSQVYSKNALSVTCTIEFVETSNSREQNSYLGLQECSFPTCIS